MGRVKVTDDRVSVDLAALSRMRKKSSIDFIQWTDDLASRSITLARRRKGNHSTLHSVNGGRLARLPDEILDRPIAALEFSIDFVAKRAKSDLEQDRDLIRAYEVLHRRLAPWKGRFASTRMGRSDAPGAYDPIVSRKPSAGVRADGSFWIVESPPARVRRPSAVSGTMRGHSVYFGHRPTPSWEGWDPTGEVQVRLYVKVTDDNKKPIPRRLWTTRMEVTLNGPPLAEILEVRSVRDLQNADMRRLVHEYLRLMSPKVDPRLTRAGAVPAVWKATVESGLSRKARQDVTGALLSGNFSAVADGLVDFHPVGKLDSAILACANDFRRAVKYAKK